MNTLYFVQNLPSPSQYDAFRATSTLASPVQLGAETLGQRRVALLCVI